MSDECKWNKNKHNDNPCPTHEVDKASKLLGVDLKDYKTTKNISEVKGSSFLTTKGEFIHSDGNKDHEEMLKDIPEQDNLIFLNDGLRNGHRVATISLPKKINDKQFEQISNFINKLPKDIKIEVHRDNHIEMFQNSNKNDILNYINGEK